MRGNIEPLSEPELEAICSKIDRMTVRVMDLDDAAGGGSAVPLKVGDHVVLLTAAHVVNKGHSLRILRKQGHAPATGLRLTAADVPHDTAILEVASADHEKLAGFATLGQVLGRFPQDRPQPVVVAGFPRSDHFRHENKTFLVGRACQTETVVPGEWPASLAELDPPPKADADIFLKYPSQTFAQIISESSQPLSNKQWIAARPPHGMSGGGIWVTCSGVTRKGVWFPMPLLAGIQTTFVRRRQLLRGSLIIHALALLRETYQDAKDEIDKALNRQL